MTATTRKLLEHWSVVEGRERPLRFAQREARATSRVIVLDNTHFPVISWRYPLNQFSYGEVVLVDRLRVYKSPLGLAVGMVLVVVAFFSVRPGPLSHHSTNDAADSTATLSPVVLRFQERFAELQRDQLEQPPAWPIVRVSRVDVDESGNYLLPDHSESVVRVHDQRGRLLHVLGGRGRGPGELLVPTDARYDETGNIHVTDIAQRRITVFNREGALVRTVPLPLELVRPYSAVPRGDSGYLVMLAGGQPDGSVVALVDSSGRVRSTHLEVGNLLPEGQREHPWWVSARYPVMDVLGDTAAVALTIMDSLWILNIRDGQVTSTPLVVPGYEPPVLVESVDQESTIEWAYSLNRFAGVFTNGTVTLIPLSLHGLYYEGGPNVLLVLASGGRRFLFRDAPTIVGVTPSGDFVGFADPDVTRLTLATYRWRDL